MACTKVLARDWTIEVYDGTEWVAIGGLNTFTLSSDKESTETTTFDSNGRAEHLPTQRANTISAEGYLEVDADTQEQDAGQAEVESLAAAVGCDGIGELHLASPNGSNEKYFEGSFNLSDIGGGTNDSTTWGFEFEVTGEPVETDPHATE